MIFSEKVGETIMWLAYAIIWISVSLTACFGVYITKSAWCLWALLLPACIGFSNTSDNKDEDKNEKEDKSIDKSN